MKPLQRLMTYGLSLSCGLLLVMTMPDLREGKPASATVQASTNLQPIVFTPQFVGMHVLSPTRHWPTIPFGALRPTGTSWPYVEPSKGKYDWHGLDSYVSVAQSHGVELDYLFLNTPQWASTRPNERCTRGPVGCAAPPNPADWEEFVTALVTRYKGRISSYELWNEPNAPGYWTGTPAQMVDMAARAYRIIKSIDPHAIVVSPSPSSSGWPQPHDVWMDQYLAAGGAKYADVIAWHGYAGRNDRPALPPEDLARQIAVLHSVLAKHHVNLPVWNTEGGWGRNTQLPDPDQQASFLVKWYLIQFTNGIARAYWYQWDGPEWGTLWREGSGVTPAGTALGQVRNWLQDVTAASPCQQQNNAVWACDLMKGDAHYRVMWNAAGTTSYSDAQGFRSAVDLDGTQHPIEGKSITVGTRPTFFRMN
ncbi:MAG TPA: glycosyl hydrolase [Acidisarcina sp.]|nr:glycosyl hydrolase [Acidisarcina sp.]